MKRNEKQKVLQAFFNGNNQPAQVLAYRRKSHLKERLKTQYRYILIATAEELAAFRKIRQVITIRPSTIQIVFGYLYTLFDEKHGPPVLVLDNQEVPDHGHFVEDPDHLAERGEYKTRYRAGKAWPILDELYQKIEKLEL